MTDDLGSIALTIISSIGADIAEEIARTRARPAFVC